MNWTDIKPEGFAEECLLLVRTKIRDAWYYSVFAIRKIESGDQEYYWGLCDLDGEEWGDYKELVAEEYLIIKE